MIWMIRLESSKKLSVHLGNDSLIEKSNENDWYDALLAMSTRCRNDALSLSLIATECAKLLVLSRCRCLSLLMLRL